MGRSKRFSPIIFVITLLTNIKHGWILNTFPLLPFPISISILAFNERFLTNFRDGIVDMSSEWNGFFVALDG